MFAAVAVVFFTIVGGVAAWELAPAYLAYWKYQPREGDLLFQSLPHSRLVNAIEGATASPYSHCGMVARVNGKWVVYEAFRKVETTPLRQFIFRGRNDAFAVYRLEPDCQQYVPATIRQVELFLGRPYDVRYRMDDEKIYCSELIYKAYDLATGGQKLGQLVRLGDLDWRPHKSTIEFYEQGPVPLNRQMITPRDLAEADQLQLVYSHNVAVPLTERAPAR
jgi:hypothetical protein